METIHSYCLSHLVVVLCSSSWGKLVHTGTHAVLTSLTGDAADQVLQKGPQVGPAPVHTARLEKLSLPGQLARAICRSGKLPRKVGCVLNTAHSVPLLPPNPLCQLKGKESMSLFGPSSLGHHDPGAGAKTDTVAH